MTALHAGGVRRALVALFLTLGGAALFAASDPGVTARAILGRDRYQTDFPAAALPDTDGASAEVPVPADPLRRTASLPVPALRTVQVVLIIAFVVIGLALLFRALPGAAPTEAALPAPVWDKKKTKRPPSVDEADALAGQGRFAEAIHALLLNALSEMASRVRSAATSPAATSREILDSPTLSSTIRVALHPIVIAVESVHFGRGTAGREDYTACLAHYQRLQAACRAGA